MPARDGLNRVYSKLDPLAFRSSFSFDSDGRLFRVQIPTGAITTTLFDVDGDQLATINPLGFRTTVIHDANENVIRTVNAAGAVTTAIYDLANRRIATINPLNFRTTLTLDGADNVKRITDPLNHINTLLYDPCDRVIAQINPLNFRMSVILDLKGQRIAAINPLNFRTTTTIDAVGQTKAVIDPLLHRTTLLWDAAGHNIGLINARGFRTTTLVDLVGRPKASIDALNERTSLIRDVAGRQIAVENALSFRTTTLYDLRDLPLATIDQLLHRNSMVYDPAGRLLRMQNGVGAITTLARDLAGQVIGTVNPLAFRTTTVFDPVGRRQATIDAKLNRTTLLWDAASRNIGTINALSNRTTQVLDAANRRIALIDANSHRSSFQFDAANQNIVQEDAVLNRTTFLLDGAGRRTRREDGRSLITTYLFDNLSRLTGREYNDGTRNTFAYDQVGGRVLMYDGTGRTSMILDALERPQAVIQPSLQRVTYGYSPIGQRIRLVTPDGGLFTYSWDAASRIQKVVNPVNEITTFGFDAADREIVDYLANATRASITYDLAGQITKLANITNTSTTLTSFGYLYDGVGNRQRVVEASLDRVSWSYDHTYQLIHEARSGTNAYNITHTWDPVGNRLVQNVSGTRTTVTYDKANEIIYSLDGTGRTTFTFDAAGNQARTISPALARTTYVWDGENRLSKVSLPTSVINTMTYNADSLRVQKIDSSGTTNSLWDGRSILLDANGARVTQALYTLLPQVLGGPLAQSRSGTSSFFQFDAFGSTAAVASTLGSITDTYVYKAFGEPVNGSGSTVNPFRFMGRRGYLYDLDLGQYYVRLREYAPSIARWISADRFGMRDGPNRYAYARNRPTALFDPTGASAIGDFFCNLANNQLLGCLCGLIALVDIPYTSGWIGFIDCVICGGLSLIETACKGKQDCFGSFQNEIFLLAMDCALSLASMAILPAPALIALMLFELTLFIAQQINLGGSNSSKCLQYLWNLVMPAPSATPAPAYYGGPSFPLFLQGP